MASSYFAQSLKNSLYAYYATVKMFISWARDCSGLDYSKVLVPEARFREDSPRLVTCLQARLRDEVNDPLGERKGIEYASMILSRFDLRLCKCLCERNTKTGIYC